MLDDPDLAQMAALSITDPTEYEKQSDPNMRDWDIYREILAEVRDAISSSTAALLGPHTKKGKPPKPDFIPRPKSAQQVAIEARIKNLDSELETDLINRMT